MNDSPHPPHDPTPDPAVDQALAALRAVDPARGSEPDPGLRELVRRRAAEGTAVVDLGAERARRRAPWALRGVAAAGAIVLAAGGGYVLGAGLDAGAADSGAEDVIVLADLPVSEEALAGPEAAMGGPAVEDSLVPAEMAGDARVADLSMPGWGGRTIFRASGLSSEGARAEAWGFDAAGAFTAGAAARAAEALEVDGEPREVDGTWLVGEEDGSGPAVRLHADGTTSISFHDPSADPWACGGAATSGSTLEEGAATLAPEVGECAERDLGAAPTQGAAAEQLTGLLDRLGVGSPDLEVEGQEDGAWTWVTAYQVVDGQRTGLAWSATFTGAGLQSLHGSLAVPVPLGEYEVISPAEAVDRLGDPRFGAGWGGPVALRADGAIAEQVLPAEPSVPPAPGPVEPGQEIRWPVREVTITEARLGLAVQWQAEGPALLVPTYELTGHDGGIWTVIAVADQHLDMRSDG